MTKAGPASSLTSDRSAPEGSSPEGLLLWIQRIAGNQAFLAGAASSSSKPLLWLRLFRQTTHQVQRAPGWTIPGPGGTRKATSGRNAAKETDFAIDRIPLEDPSLGAAGGNTSKAASPDTKEEADNRAIVLVPSSVNTDKDIQILLFFHGNNVGNRTFGANRNRDLDEARDRMEQQMSAGGSAQLVAILPQGDLGSKFGTIAKDPKTYIQACLDLVPVPTGKKKLNQNGGIIAGGHSGGGNVVADMATAEAKSGVAAEPGLKAITIFDGINNFPAKDTTDPAGKRRLNTLAGHDRVDAFIDLSVTRATHDIIRVAAELAKGPDPIAANAAAGAYLDQSFVFRAYFQNSGLYNMVHGVLADALKIMFGETPPHALGHGVTKAVAPLPGLSALSAGLKGHLRENYQVIPVGASSDKAKHDANLAAGKMDTLANADTTFGHDAMVGSGALADAFGHIHGVGRGKGLTPVAPPGPTPSPHAVLDQMLDAVPPGLLPADLRQQLLAVADNAFPADTVTTTSGGKPLGAGSLLGFAANGTSAAEGGESAAVARARTAAGSMAHTQPEARPRLARGSSGSAVTELQSLLNTAVVADPPLAADGVFGPKTSAAVGRFQKKHGLSVDHIVGKQTWGALDSTGAETDETTPTNGRVLEKLEREPVAAAPARGGGPVSGLAAAGPLLGFGPLAAGAGAGSTTSAVATTATDELVALAVSLARADGQPKPAGGSFLRRPDVQLALDNRASDPDLAAAFSAFELVVKILPNVLRAICTNLFARGILRFLEKKFILDSSKSGLDLLPPDRAKLYKNFKWDKNDYPGHAPGEPAGPHEGTAAAMATEMTVVRPERRPNSGPDAVMTAATVTTAKRAFISSHLSSAGGATLYDEAAAALTQMQGQATTDGVSLKVLSSWRDPAVALANAKKSGNPAAVASFSSHSLGLAIDLKMHADPKAAEMQTHPMQDVADERASPVYKWMLLQGEVFGWYPYGNEPWHWEYNPPGLNGRFFSRMAPKP